MKYYISDILPRLKKFSASLDNTSLLIDKPWIVVTNTESVQEKIIFRRNGEVHFVKNGNVEDGKWEYLPEARSLLLKHGDSKKLYKHQFLDEAVLSLMLDGKNDNENIYLFVNENIIYDLDPVRYLTERYFSNSELKKGRKPPLKKKRSKSITKVRYKGNILVFQKSKSHPTIGDKVDGIENGKFKAKISTGKTIKVTIKDGKVKNVYHIPDFLRDWF